MCDEAIRNFKTTSAPTYCGSGVSATCVVKGTSKPVYACCPAGSAPVQHVFPSHSTGKATNVRS